MYVKRVMTVVMGLSQFYYRIEVRGDERVSGG